MLRVRADISIQGSLSYSQSNLGLLCTLCTQQLQSASCKAGNDSLDLCARLCSEHENSQLMSVSGCVQLVKFVDLSSTAIAALEAELAAQAPQCALALVGTHAGCTQAEGYIKHALQVCKSHCDFNAIAESTTLLA